MRTLAFLGMITLAAAVSYSASDHIYVVDLQTKTVIGHLGKPLGSRTVIDGTWSTKAVMLANPLDVTGIDGRTVTNAVTIEIRGNASIKQGIRYKLEGYESAAFEGPPEWLAPDIQQPFQFRSFFVATKVVQSNPM